MQPQKQSLLSSVPRAQIWPSWTSAANGGYVQSWPSVGTTSWWAIITTGASDESRPGQRMRMPYSSMRVSSNVWNVRG